MFRIETFLQECADSSWADIVSRAEDAKNRLKQLSYGSKGAVALREQGTPQYIDDLGEFLYFMRTQQRGDNDRKFYLYKPIAESMVAAGIFRPEVLKLFP